MSHRIQRTAEIQDRYSSHLLQLLLIGLLKFEVFNIINICTSNILLFFWRRICPKKEFIPGQCNGRMLLHIQIKSDFLGGFLLVCFLT